MSTDRNLMDRLMAVGEDRIEHFLQEAVNNPTIAQAFGRLIQGTQETRTRVEDTLQELFKMANLPDGDAIGDLTDRIELAETRLSDLLTRLEKITENATASVNQGAQEKTVTRKTTGKKKAAKKTTTKKKTKKKVAKKTPAKKKTTKKKAAKKATTKKTASKKTKKASKKKSSRS